MLCRNIVGGLRVVPGTNFCASVTHRTSVTEGTTLTSSLRAKLGIVLAFLSTFHVDTAQTDASVATMAFSSWRTCSATSAIIRRSLVSSIRRRCRRAKYLIFFSVLLSEKVPVEGILVRGLLLLDLSGRRRICLMDFLFRLQVNLPSRPSSISCHVLRRCSALD